MSKRREIKHKVEQAVLHLLNKGERPSSRKVIQIMGQGSFSTVCPILSETSQLTNHFQNVEPLLKNLRSNPEVISENLTQASDQLLEQLSQTIDKLEAENLKLRKQVLKTEQTAKTINRLFKKMANRVH